MADQWKTYTCFVSKVSETGGGKPITPANTDTWATMLTGIARAVGIPNASQVQNAIGALISVGVDGAAKIFVEKHGMTLEAATKSATDLGTMLDGSGCGATVVSAATVAPVGPAPIVTTAGRVVTPEGLNWQTFLQAQQAAAQEQKAARSALVALATQAAQPGQATPEQQTQEASKKSTNMLLLGGAALAALLLLRVK